jgi:hypothetical protein
MDDPIYLIKCDECKVAIGTTNSPRISYEGGLCPACRLAARYETEDLQAWMKEVNQ